MVGYPEVIRSIGSFGMAGGQASSFFTGPLTVILPLSPRRLQFPIPVGLHLLLIPASMFLGADESPRKKGGDRAASRAYLPQLSAEILSLLQQSLSPDFRTFLSIFQQLITAAHAEQTPIVFV